ncbi:MAG: hypothetical protein HQL25_04725 [Candidatus Omnitrophica bacterium]|nr:hypothetical protein [Candidatus Omnitrophota bacterium]
MKKIFWLILGVIVLSNCVIAEAYQTVKVSGRQLVVDFDQDGIDEPYFIKGVSYMPTPIGRFPSDWGYASGDPRQNNIFDDAAILDRDFNLLSDMNANTIRIWFGNQMTVTAADVQDPLSPWYNQWTAIGRNQMYLTQTTFDTAESHGLKVIAGFYMPTADYTNTSIRSGLISKFTAYVNAFKLHSALLFWAIGNENNLAFDTSTESGRQQIRAYYSLVNEMAEAAHSAEGTSFHPVAVVDGGINMIGVSDYGTTDSQMTSLNIWGSNLYQGISFGSTFTSYAVKSQKPFWVSEYGADAWHTSDINNPDNGYEDQATQAVWAGQLYGEIANNSDKVIGGTIMEYSDEWWKPYEWQCGTDSAVCNNTQNHFGFGPVGNAPDQFMNEEWWGLVKIAKNSDPAGADFVTPRQVYNTLLAKYLKPVYLNNLHLAVPVYENITPYFSTAAASAQMVINFIRLGAGQSLIDQTSIYQYARLPGTLGGELYPNEIAKVLGHFDPYDQLVSDSYDRYDSLPAGNPYQGYNFSVDTYATAGDPTAFVKYIRDICHWMAYRVTKKVWWSGGDLVEEANTPAIVPLYGNYNNWVVINGYAASDNPNPDPRNPFYSPDFTVYGFWITDPKTSGIGRDTYKTVSEVSSTYFFPVSSSDQYNGKFLQVAEPPPVKSKSNIKLSISKPDMANLDFAQGKLTLRAGKNVKIKTNWRDIVDQHLLINKEAVAAFEKKQQGELIKVARTDNRNEDYYLLPFGAKKRAGFYATGVIILNAKDGKFKEAAWTEKPELFLNVTSVQAKILLKQRLYNDYLREVNLLYKKADRAALLKIQVLYYELIRKLRGVTFASSQLAWKPGYYSNSPYKPYWVISIEGIDWIITQDGQVKP